MFFLTSIAHYPIALKTPNKRCFGYFSTEEKAITAVACNAGNMEECYYNFLVIEEISEGIHSIPISETWYTWNTDIGWVPSEKPEWSIGFTNWSLG